MFPDHVDPVHNVRALSKNICFIIGKMIGTCVLQCGETPTCISCCRHYLVFESVESPVDLDDIPDCLVLIMIRGKYGGGGGGGGGLGRGNSSK